MGGKTYEDFYSGSPVPHKNSTLESWATRRWSLMEKVNTPSERPPVTHKLCLIHPLSMSGWGSPVDSFLERD